MARVTAMAAGGEQTRSAHARDVSLGARIGKKLYDNNGATAETHALHFFYFFFILFIYFFFLGGGGGA